MLCGAMWWYEVGVTDTGNHVLHVILIYIDICHYHVNFLIICFCHNIFIWNTFLDSEKRKASELLSAAIRSSGAYFVGDHLLRQGDQEARRYIENFKPLVNKKIKGMVGARRAVASKVGAAVVDRRGMRATADDRGQQQAIVQARENCNKK